MAAIDGKVTVVMKTGRMVKKGSGEMGFEGDWKMTQALANLIDVGKAEAAVKADEEMIKGQAERMPGGLEGINRRAVSAILASRTSTMQPAVQAAACGDDALGIEGASQTQLDERLGWRSWQGRIVHSTPLCGLPRWWKEGDQCLERQRPGQALLVARTRDSR